MSAQVAVDGKDALGLDLEEHGVDELDDIVAAQAGQEAVEARHIANAAPFAGRAHEVDVARVVFPEVAIGEHGDLVSQLAEPFGERPMHVAVFA